MPEMTDLQTELLKVIKGNTVKVKELFSTYEICKLTSSEIIKKMKIKPSNENYLSRMIKSLEKKKKLKSELKYSEGEGQKRIITIL